MKRILILAALAFTVSASAIAQNTNQQTTSGGPKEWQDTATYVLKLKLWDLGKLTDKVGEHAQLVKANAVNRTAEQITADAKIVKEDEQLYQWLMQQLQMQITRHQRDNEKITATKEDQPQKQ